MKSVWRDWIKLKTPKLNSDTSKIVYVFTKLMNRKDYISERYNNYYPYYFIKYMPY